LITESWCHQEITNAYLSLEGYELIPDLRMDREDTAQGRGGGILVYVKSGLTVVKCDSGIEFSQHCMFKVSGVLVYLVYRSPNSPPAAMENLIKLVQSVKRNTIMIGDFNFPDIDWSTGEASRKSTPFMEAVEDAMMDQLVTFPTQVRGNILDLCLTNVPARVVSVIEGGRLGQSDHEMIEILVRAENARPEVKEVKNWKRANWDRMRKEVSRVNWQREFRDKSAEEMWTMFKTKLLMAAKKNVPTKKVGGSGRAAWMTKEIMAALRKKKKLWLDVKNGSPSDIYKEQEKLVRRLIKNAKKNFERRLANEKGNRRPFYSYVKKKSKNKSTIGPLKDKNHKVITEDVEMAEELNNYFSSVFTREGEGEVPKAADRTSEKLTSAHITTWEVRKKIRKLRSEAAGGPDEIGPRILKELEDEIVEALTMIFSKSLATGGIPGDWKKANVTPIYKKGAQTDAGNYRPVSLTSVCCKLMESVLRDKIMNHLLENKLINESQHGFMSNKSCCTNLLEFFEKVTKAVDNGEPYDVVFLDFAKAFDKVPRKRLLEKLRAHGISGEIFAWIAEWLTGRTQRVVLNGRSSSWKEVLSGVPQGSVLGPILFLIFINDLDSVAAVEMLRKFADDTKLGQTVRTPEDVEKLQTALDELCTWAEKWGMEFNIKKCKVMHFGHTNPKKEYRMRGHVLERTEDERDIGIKVTANLKPAAQCKKAAQTAQTVLAQISRAFHFRDRKIFTGLYIQYLRPHLEFSSPVWSPWTAADKEILEKVQRRAVGMISGLKGTSYEEKLLELKMETLEERRHQIDMKQTFKILRGQDNVDKSSWFEMAASTGRVTRLAADPLNLKVPVAKLEVRKNFYSQRIPEAWNQIPAEIKQAKNARCFRNQYQNHRHGQAAAAHAVT
jgi:hypothetical protein